MSVMDKYIHPMPSELDIPTMDEHLTKEDDRDNTKTV